MSTLKYVRLRNSDGSLDKKFRVVSDTLEPLDDKMQTRRRTLTGKSDSQQGAVFEAWAFTVRVRAQETDASYGTLADLRTFYAYNNPTPASGPSNLITFYDNLNVSHTVEIIGQLPRKNLIPILDGINAIYMVTLQMEEVKA